MKSTTKQTFKNSQVNLQRVLQTGKAAGTWSIPKTEINCSSSIQLCSSLLGTSDNPPITPTLAILEAHNFRKEAMLIFNAEAPNVFGDVEKLVKAVQVFEDEKNAEFFLTLSEAIRWRWVRSKIALNSK
ncbi:hypothetical protein CROQUDRAFT_664779 [Cronartium quercuum f. sp. fusiforme G11]|uniref:Uncharacterized protein n=1 Tax=Cronartium quercuum f. sp. fusiforme G11 TaxID=708437 RepID=A0A9P6N6Q6_9BASI|nr:hypothetical protein CROQUDRAFT_664779 [Cronartium quercuum f. sp. fusiforme G11]